MNKFIKLGLGAAAAGGVLYLVFRPEKAAASTILGGGAAAGPTDGGAEWNGDVKAMQAKLNGLGASLSVDGKAGTQTCRAAESIIAAGKADADIKAFAKSKQCGFGLPRAPCGITGPVASDNVKRQILDAAVKRGYPRGDVEKAINRESRWHPSAVACAQTGTKHAIAGGLMQFIPVALKAVGFDGSPDQFASLTGEQQLPYLLKFLSKMPQSTGGRPGDFGLALFWPVAVNEPDSFVIAAKDGPNPLVWEQNPGLRSPKPDGPITAGSVRATAR